MNVSNLDASVVLALENSQIINNFIVLFVKCEIYCKNLISESTNIKFSEVKLHVGTIKKVFKKNGIVFSDDLIDKMFSSKLTNIGSMSLKFIRDKYLHELKKSSVNEIINRSDELNDIMINFLSYFE